MSKISRRFYYAGSLAFFIASTFLLLNATTTVDRLGLSVYLLGSFCFILGTAYSTRKRA